MTVKLIMLIQPILVTSEPVVAGPGEMFFDKKIIAGGGMTLPHIDWNGLEHKYGAIDVRKQYAAFCDRIPDGNATSLQFFNEGLRVSQVLGRVYSLVDMYGMLDECKKAVKECTSVEFAGTDYVRALAQPKTYEVEVEKNESDNSYKILR